MFFEKLRYRFRFAKVHREWRHLNSSLVSADTSELSGWGRYLNQPFTIWFFSAIVVGLLTAYHSASQQCHEQAEKTYTDIGPPLNELSARLRQIREKAPTLIEILGNADRQKNYDLEIDKIFRGEIGFQSNFYKNQSLVTVLASYNSLARQITAKVLPTVKVIEKTIWPPLKGETINTRRDIQFYPFTIYMLQNGEKFNGSTSAEKQFDDWINSDLAEIGLRRFLLLLGERVDYCSIFALSFWERFLTGYSDKPKLELFYHSSYQPI